MQFESWFLDFFFLCDFNEFLAMENRNMRRRSFDDLRDLVIGLVMPYIEDSRDRDSISLVCRRWYELDAETRKHVTIAFCYTTSPERLKKRFPNLKSLKLKGQPRAAMFNLIPKDWGGYVTDWVNEIAVSFNSLNSLHFRRMIVNDSDLELLARTRGCMLDTLKLDKCSGFSTDGLRHVARSCRILKTLFLEESSIDENDGNWLHELALNNTVLETLNFYATDLAQVDLQDLETIARNCRSLVSMKISDYEILDLVGFFRAAAVLEEFCGGSINDNRPEKYSLVSFPQRLRRLGLTYMGRNEMSIVFPFASQLTKLDLLYTLLDTEDHCVLIHRCPNLEVLETRNVIGDRGLEVLGQTCRKLKRLRIERGADEQGMEDEEGTVSQRGLIAIAEGCPELEYLAVHVTDITNGSLASIGNHLKKLTDFRLVLLEREETIADLPLDNGVRALLIGCERLRRFAFYLRPGGLTDVGMTYIGQYSCNVRWMLLGHVGESDAGLLEFSRGCPSLQKLEMRGCCFSEHALAVAATQLVSLRYVWVQGYRASATGRDLLVMARRFWNIELIPARKVEVVTQAGEVVIHDNPAHILAYYSLAGQRTDYPETVVPLEIRCNTPVNCI